MRHWRHWPGICPNLSQCDGWRSTIFDWIQIHEHLLQVGTIFIYLQIVCALVGSLSATYSGVPAMELAISLFALVALESGSHLLFKIYICLLACSLLMDVFWFVFVANTPRNVEKFSTLAFQTTLTFQATGVAFRLTSAFIWLRVYHRGLSEYNAPVDFDPRLEILGEAPSLWPPLLDPEAGSSSSTHPETLAGSIYDPLYYYSLFEDTKGGERELILNPESSSRTSG